MAIYRSKPRFVIAFQYDGDFKGTDGKYYAPDWAVRALESGQLVYKDAGELYIRADVVDLHVAVSDYLIYNSDSGYIDRMDAETFEAQFVKEPTFPDGSAGDYHM